MEVSSQPHVLITLPLGKELQAFIGQEAGWASSLIKMKRSCPCQGANLVTGPFHSLYLYMKTHSVNYIPP
jgi:hypothetical protein